MDQRFLKNIGCFVRDEFGIPSTEDSQACWEARDEQEAQEAERDYCDFHEAAVHYDFANPGPNWLGIQAEACRLSGSP